MMWRALARAAPRGGGERRPTAGAARRGRHSVAVVGAGPAGFYTADRLLARGGNDVHVDMIERWPVPYGLVRYGVAPDHPEVKNCTSKFEQMLADPGGRCRLVANVAVGRDVSVAALQAHYDAVVLAYGAEDDRRMDIPGETLAGVHAARAFVGWYNGAPDFAGLPVDLDGEHAVIVGAGNVALDIARVLLTPVDLLRKTDIAEHALAALAQSRIRSVDVVVRRGPAQVAFTIKEFREMTTVPGTRVAVHRARAVTRLLDEARPAWEKERTRRRLMELLDKTAKQSAEDSGAGAEPASPADAAVPPPLPPPLPSPPSPPPPPPPLSRRLWRLRFLQSPVAVLADPSGARATGLRLAANTLDPVTQAVAPSPGGATEDLPASLIVRSIGYQSRPLPGVPFDLRRSLVPNEHGRVPGGLYVAGWLKSGPVGVIASTLASAHETADAVLADLAASRSTAAGRPWLDAHLWAAGVPVVHYRGWQAIDALEREQGQRRGADRVKLVDVDEMVRVALAAQHAVSS